MSMRLRPLMEEERHFKPLRNVAIEKSLKGFYQQMQMLTQLVQPGGMGEQHSRQLQRLVTYLSSSHY